MTSVPEAHFAFQPGDVLAVTGAASGIGRAVAVGAARQGLVVSAWDLNPEGLAETAALVREAGGVVTTTVADAADETAVRDGFAAAQAQLGPIHYLANIAGPSASAPLTFDVAIRQTLGSVRCTTQAWVGGDLPSGAAMVAASSLAGAVLGTGSDWYCAAKAGVLGYVRHLAVTHAGEFRANAVAPGMTDTPRLAGFAGTDAGKRSLARIPLGRLATPEEVAATVLFLLSPVAAYITGVLVPVDGGWSIAP